jgi:hypothetical protein
MEEHSHHCNCNTQQPANQLANHKLVLLLYITHYFIIIKIWAYKLLTLLLLCSNQILLTFYFTFTFYFQRVINFTLARSSGNIFLKIIWKKLQQIPFLIYLGRLLANWSPLWYSPPSRPPNQWPNPVRSSSTTSPRWAWSTAHQVVCCIYWEIYHHPTVNCRVVRNQALFTMPPIVKYAAIR